VKVVLELDQQRPARMGAGKTHGHLHRLGAGGGEAHPLGGRDQLLYPPPPFDLKLV
jgi:hypothetical protein